MNNELSESDKLKGRLVFIIKTQKWLLSFNKGEIEVFKKSKMLSYKTLSIHYSINLN